MYPVTLDPSSFNSDHPLSSRASHFGEIHVSFQRAPMNVHKMAVGGFLRPDASWWGGADGRFENMITRQQNDRNISKVLRSYFLQIF